MAMPEEFKNYKQTYTLNLINEKREEIVSLLNVPNINRKDLIYVIEEYRTIMKFYDVSKLRNISLFIYNVRTMESDEQIKKIFVLHKDKIF